VRDCLEEEVDVPIGLVVSLLEEKIEGMRDGGWILVCGFPASLDQLLEFERKVSISQTM
jgi:putative hydrolases of HD superfamily